MGTKDNLIIKLHGEGKSLREIGEIVNLSHVAVKKRLDRMSSVEKPLPDEDGRINTSKYPNLQKAVMKIDEIIADIQRQTGQNQISIETPAGWKIDSSS